MGREIEGDAAGEERQTESEAGELWRGEEEGQGRACSYLQVPPSSYVEHRSILPIVVPYQAGERGETRLDGWVWLLHAGDIDHASGGTVGGVGGWWCAAVLLVKASGVARGAPLLLAATTYTRNSTNCDGVRSHWTPPVFRSRRFTQCVKYGVGYSASSTWRRREE